MTRSDRYLALALVAIVAVFVGVPAFVTGFFRDYMMNDLPSGRDHLDFTATMAVGAVLAAVLSTCLLRALTGAWSMALRIGGGGTIAAHGLVLALCFGTSTGSFGDAAGVGYGAWTSAQVAAYAGAWALASAAGTALVVVALRDRRHAGASR